MEEKVEKKKNKKAFWVIVAIIIATIIFGGVLLWVRTCCAANKEGNTIGNIRNYGCIVEKGDKIYFVAPSEDGYKKCIYKSDKKGNNKEVILSEDWDDILSLNIRGNNIYFIASSNSEDVTADSVDNKIYKMKLNGTDRKVINDNEFNDDSYEFYIINDLIYYIGEDSNIYTMDLEGNDKKAINSDGTGFLGITNKYIILNISDTDEYNNEKIVTYKMNLDGSDKKAINGDRLYSINIIGDELYYVDAEKKIKKVNLATDEEFEISSTTAYYLNVSKDKMYFLNYIDSSYNIGIYSMDLDGKNEELIVKLDTYSTFLGVVDNYVFYIDSNDEKGVINIASADKKEVYNLYEYTFEQEEKTEEVVQETTSSEE